MIFCHTSNKREINRSLKLNSSTLALLPGTKTQWNTRMDDQIEETANEVAKVMNILKNMLPTKVSRIYTLVISPH